MADKANNNGRIRFQREVSKKQRALFDSACPAGTVQGCLKTGKGFTHSKRTSTVVKWMSGPGMSTPPQWASKSKFYLQQIIPSSCANLATHYQGKTCMSSPFWPSLFLYRHPNLQINHNELYKFKRYHRRPFPRMMLTPHSYKQQTGWENATHQ